MRCFLIFVVLLLTSTTAVAERLCHHRKVLIDYLQTKYLEKRVVVMVDGNGRLVELFDNKKTGSWSILVTEPGQKLSCIVSFGFGIRFIQPEESRKEFPAYREESG